MPFNIIFLLVIGCVITFMIGGLIILTERWHGRWTLDEHQGVQKFHSRPTPRVGGLSVVVSLFVILWFCDANVSNLLLPLLIAGLIPFFYGFKEDVTKNVSVRDRLLATLVGALVAVYLTGQYLNRVDVMGLDWLMQWWLTGVLVTVVAISGVTNAINILDGFNGLASGTTIVMLAFLALVAYQANDWVLIQVCLMLGSSLLGFMLLNYPFGKIFLGDAGAYFTGFLLAWLALLLPMRNPEISTWASLLVCAYPVVEVLYSMIRRKLARFQTGRPDNLHLHTLIKTRIIRRYFIFLPNWARNALVAPIIWFCSTVLGLMASCYASDVLMLVVLFVSFVLWYHVTYLLLIKLPEFNFDGARVE